MVPSRMPVNPRDIFVAFISGSLKNKENPDKINMILNWIILWMPKSTNRIIWLDVYTINRSWFYVLSNYWFHVSILKHLTGINQIERASQYNFVFPRNCENYFQLFPIYLNFTSLFSLVYVSFTVFESVGVEFVIKSEKF